jgi:hypothetical protein
LIRSGPRPSLRTPTKLPRASPCALPITLIKGQPGVRFDLTVNFLAGRRHLPIVTLTLGLNLALSPH